MSKRADRKHDSVEALYHDRQVEGVHRLPIKDLSMDEGYQRRLGSYRLQQIANHYDPKYAGVIYVNLRDDGRLFVVDGQHRVVAAGMAGHTSMLAYVWVGLTQAEEADMFDKVNCHRGPVPALDRFRARLMAGEKKARMIQAAIDASGVTVPMRSAQGGKGAPKNTFVAITAAETVWDHDGGAEMLTRVLSILSHTFDGDSAALSSNALRGLAFFLNRYGQKADINRVIDRMKTVGYDAIARDARVLAEHGGLSARDSWMRAIRKAYNWRTTSNRLPE